MKKEIWYRAVAYYDKDNSLDEYFCNEVELPITAEKMKISDEGAIRSAKEWAENGVEFSDAGHCDLELEMVTEVDGEKECFPDIRDVWW